MSARFVVGLAAMLLLSAPAAAQLAKVPWPDRLSPETRANLAANDARPAAPPTIEGRRERSEAVQQDIGQPRLKRYGVEMAEDRIAGVPVRIFLPKAERANGPFLMSLHGGGFLVDSGSITENAAIAAMTGYRVVAVRYRLSPEHAFPAAVEDAAAVYRVLLKERPGIRIGLYGTSAGAILSAQLIAHLRAHKLPIPGALGFFSGTADISRWGDSITLFGAADTAARMGTAYAGDRPVTDPLVSPLLGDLSAWPATLCVSSTRDYLLSPTADLCRALDAAGVRANLILHDGLPHAFWAYIDGPETDEAFAGMARFLRSALETRK